MKLAPSRRSVSLLFAGVLLSNCSTPYKSGGLQGGFIGGGYKERKLDEHTFIVSFRGNRLTEIESVESMFIRRCAELTVENGFDYFIVKDRSFIDARRTVGTAIMYKSGQQPPESQDAHTIVNKFKN